MSALRHGSCPPRCEDRCYSCRGATLELLRVLPDNVLVVRGVKVDVILRTCLVDRKDHSLARRDGVAGLRVDARPRPQFTTDRQGFDFIIEIRWSKPRQSADGSPKVH